MAALSIFVKGLPFLAACVAASASYPPIPADLTTPVQQRIAINGPNGNFIIKNFHSHDIDLISSDFRWLEHLRGFKQAMCAVWHLQRCPHLGGLLY
jgi:hypothetical protein